MSMIFRGHDPLAQRHKTEAEKLNQRWKTASETSKEIAVRRDAFFDWLVLINAGALTFCVTLLGTPSLRHLHSMWTLDAAWLFLLFAVGACLGRNLLHQHYQMADAMAKMAESEVTFIDVDQKVIRSLFCGSVTVVVQAVPFSV
jgi:hypothetical protein